MSFSTAVIVSLLFFCISDASASVIPGEVTKQNLQQFNVHIVERGTKYVEKIVIDEKNDLEFFQVPAHNGITEGDYLYDFKSNISVRRDKSNATCYVGPLPDDLPKPADLRAALQRVSDTPSKRKVIVRKYWFVSEEVDKALLSQAVQDFCGQFRVYRLQEVDLSSASTSSRHDPGQSRFARKIELSKIPFCDNNSAPQKVCDPNTYLFTFKISETRCTWWLKNCKFSTISKKVCEDWEHKFNSMVCYKIRCP